MRWSRNPRGKGSSAEVDTYLDAQEALNSYTGPKESKEYHRLNDAVQKAAQEVPRAVRDRWI